MNQTRNVDTLKGCHGSRGTLFSVVIVNLFLIFTIGFIVVHCRNTPKSTANQEKLLLIGLDGASWKFINPLLKKGELPHFKALIQNGLSAQLKTFKPTQSVIIWSSILTGCKPEKHGIKGWLSGAGDQLSITADMRREPALWDIAAQFGIKGLYVNWWTSWPPSKNSSGQITNMLMYDYLPHRVYPTTVAHKVQQLLSQYRLRDRIKSAGTLSIPSLAHSAFRKQVSKDDPLFYLTENLGSGDDYRIIALYVRGIDIVEHEYYAAARPEEFSESAVADPIKGRFIDDYYRWIDYRIGHLIESLHLQNANKIIVSDHGMEPLKVHPPLIANLLLNKLLESLGYAKIKDEYSLDWSHTRAYQKGYHETSLRRSIAIHSESGNSSEMNTTKKELVHRLRNLRVWHHSGDKDASSPLFTLIDANRRPNDEIMVELNKEVKPEDVVIIDHSRVTIDTFLTHFLVHNSGQHKNAPDGIIIMEGPAFKRGGDISHVKVLDVLPTLLTTLHIPISSHLDGMVMRDALQPSVPRQTSNTLQRPYTLPQLVISNPQSYLDRKTEKKIRNELRTLGYIQ